MSAMERIIELNRLHPEWHEQQLAEAAGCGAAWVRQVCRKKGLKRAPKPRGRYKRKKVTTRANTIPVRVDAAMESWLCNEAEQMGPGISVRDVIVAILRDARAGD